MTASPHNSSTATSGWSRRSWLSAAGAAAAALIVGRGTRAAADTAPVALAGRINHSVVPWCFKPMTPEKLIHAAHRLGCRSVELIDPQYWPLLKQLGLVCAISGSHSFAKGWNHTEYHDECREKVGRAIDRTADAGFFSVITFTGMQEQLTDDEGFRNTVAGLKTVLGQAERRKVNLCLEPLNTRVDIEMKGHPGYQCDTIEWAVRLCDTIGSPRLKILFDVYHVQIMQGDVITRIRQFKDYIAHYHTAGNPGRNDLDDTQEINYPAIMQAIVETGYTGYVGHEFIPKADDDDGKIAALAQGIAVCDV